MDEGSVAKDEEFQRYADRFKNVFYVPNHDVTVSPQCNVSCSRSYLILLLKC